MARFLTTDQRRVIVETYLRTGSLEDTRAEFTRLFPDRRLPSRSVIFYNVRKYHTHGTSLNRLEPTQDVGELLALLKMSTWSVMHWKKIQG